MENLLTEMGERLSKRRKQLGLTQEQLAEMAGSTTQTISTAETGRKALRPENVLKLCDALDISIDYLFRGQISDQDFSLLSTKISQLTPEQYQYLETIIGICYFRLRRPPRRNHRFLGLGAMWRSGNTILCGVLFEYSQDDFLDLLRIRRWGQNDFRGF